MIDVLISEAEATFNSMLSFIELLGKIAGLWSVGANHWVVIIIIIIVISVIVIMVIIIIVIVIIVIIVIVIIGVFMIGSSCWPTTAVEHPVHPI